MIMLSLLLLDVPYNPGEQYVLPECSVLLDLLTLNPNRTSLLAVCCGRWLLRAARLGNPAKVDRVVLVCAQSSADVYTLPQRHPVPAKPEHLTLTEPGWLVFFKLGFFFFAPDRQKALIWLRVSSKTGCYNEGFRLYQILIMEAVLCIE